MKIDLHVHTAHSDDAYGEPEEVLAAAAAAGLDGLAITEHSHYEKSEIFLKLAPRFNLVVFAGAEVATRSGHMLVFSEEIHRWNCFRGEGNDARELIKAVNRAGGRWWRPPYRAGHCGAAARLSGLVPLKPRNGANWPREPTGLELAQKLNLPAPAAAMPFISEIGRCYTFFTVPVRDVSGWCAPKRAGATLLTVIKTEVIPVERRVTSASRRTENPPTATAATGTAIRNDRPAAGPPEQKHATETAPEPQTRRSR